MNQQYAIGGHRSCFALFLFLALSCTTTKEADVLDRRAQPEVLAGVPAGTSEIRELKFHKLASEAGHDVLHLRGMLYAKSTAGSSTRITACSGCVLRLTSPADTTIAANLTTATDGYFEYTGKILPYTFTLNHPGMNPLAIEGVVFSNRGITTLKIVQAMGATPERFTVARRGDDYSWTKVQ